MHQVPTSRAGGCKVTFPRAVMAASEDALALWQQAERAQAMAEDASLPRSVRQGWHGLMDELQECEKARLVLLQRTAESHDRAVAVAPTARCRDYSATDLGYSDLMQLCRKRCPQPMEGDAEEKRRSPVSAKTRLQAG